MNYAVNRLSIYFSFSAQTKLALASLPKEKCNSFKCRVTNSSQSSTFIKPQPPDYQQHQPQAVADPTKSVASSPQILCDNTTLNNSCGEDYANILNLQPLRG